MRLAATAAAMLALSFAAVPFYDWFCRVTGYGGTVATAAAPDGPARPVVDTGRCAANVARGWAATFRP
jgi:cytochrome c oxidase assembly protein subunit 11